MCIRDRSEVLVLCMSVCETLGVLLLHCFLQIGGILNIDVVMQYCLEVAFSKIVLIFLYYVLINRLITVSYTHLDVYKRQGL